MDISETVKVSIVTRVTMALEIWLTVLSVILLCFLRKFCLKIDARFSTVVLPFLSFKSSEIWNFYA